MSENQYSWVGVYREIAKTLVAKYKESPSELFNSLRGIDLKVPGDVDPFAIFEWLVGKRRKGQDDIEMSDSARMERIVQIRRLLGLLEKLPTDLSFVGLPKRKRDTWWYDISVRESDATIRKIIDGTYFEKTWQLAEYALLGSFNEQFANLFVECLGIKDIGPANLTCGLYWINPEKFTPIDTDTAKFFVKEEVAGMYRFVNLAGGVAVQGREKEFGEWYRGFLVEVLPKYGNVPELVHQIYLPPSESIEASSGSEPRSESVDDTKDAVKPVVIVEEPEIYWQGGEIPGSPGYRRNSDARNKCLQTWGYECAICCFDFEKAYGELGKGYIQVHHLIPVSEGGGEEHMIDPIWGLIPACPNCHAMLHKESPPIPPERLAKIMAEHRK